MEPTGQPVDIDTGDSDVHVGGEHADQEHGRGEADDGRRTSGGYQSAPEDDLGDA